MEDRLSLRDILRKGEAFYFETLKEDLEKTNRGDYAIIDVEEEDYVLDKDRLSAVNKAKQKFGEGKIFYVARVGETSEPTYNTMMNRHAAWGI